MHMIPVPGQALCWALSTRTDYLNIERDNLFEAIISFSYVDCGSFFPPCAFDGDIRQFIVVK